MKEAVNQTLIGAEAQCRHRAVNRPTLTKTLNSDCMQETIVKPTNPKRVSDFCGGKNPSHLGAVVIFGGGTHNVTSWPIGSVKRPSSVSSFIVLPEAYFNLKKKTDYADFLLELSFNLR